MQILKHVSWCICSAVSWKQIPRNGGVWLSEPTYFPAEWLSSQHSLQEGWSVHFAALSVQLPPTPGIVFVLIFANLIDDKKYCTVTSVCISLVSGEAKHLFSHLWAVWISPAENRHCPVLGKAPLGVSSPPYRVFPTGLVSQEGRVFALRLWQPASTGISRDPVPWLPGAPVHVPHHKDLTSQICLKKKFLQTHPENTFQGWLLAGFEEPCQKKLLEHSFKVPCSWEV